MTGDQLRTWREGRGWGPARAAARFGVEQWIWNEWESAAQPIPSYVADGVAQYVRVDQARAKSDLIHSRM